MRKDLKFALAIGSAVGLSACGATMEQKAATGALAGAAVAGPVGAAVGATAGAATEAAEEEAKKDGPRA